MIDGLAVPLPMCAAERERRIAALAHALNDERDARRWDAELIRTMEAALSRCHQRINTLERERYSATAPAA